MRPILRFGFDPMTADRAPLRGISSMAMRAVVVELADRFSGRGEAPEHPPVSFESVGGVDAARRVTAGEPFDVVVLGSDAIDRLAASGHVVAGSRTDLARSGVAIAIRRGGSRPEVGDENALRRAVLAAKAIGHSTGPSGVALLRLFDRWGIRDAIADRLIEAPPGVPVASLIARGDVGLGFQQLSELMHEDGIDILGPMPDTVRIDTVFSGALCTASVHPAAARELLALMAGPHTVEILARHGMTSVPVRST